MEGLLRVLTVGVWLGIAVFFTALVLAFGF
jgi:hypothetical protein